MNVLGDRLELLPNAYMYKGLGSERVKMGPVKIAKFQSRKIIFVLSFLICRNFNLLETC